MRVVHIIKHCGYGNGSVHMAVDLACMQAESGHDVTFVSQGGTFEPLLAKYGVRHLNLPHEQTKPSQLLRAAWALVGLTKRAQPDVLHAHMMGSALIGFLASRVSGVPLVTTVHNSFDWHSCIMRLGDRIVAVSRAEKKYLLSRGFPANRMEVVVNGPIGSPRAVFMGSDSHCVLKPPCIITVCGLHYRKGLSDLIAACANVFVDLSEWRLYIAGEGPDCEALQQQARDSGVSANIIFLGYVREPGALLRQSDVFVLASHAEPFGLSVAEARAAGCAIVATNVGGIPEVLDFGKAGRLVPAGRPDLLAAELHAVMSDESVRMQLRSDALAGSEKFDVRRLVNDYNQVYCDARRSLSNSAPLCSDSHQ
jgi:glycosyltransferase involved in cell wall biosynthesis